MKSNETGKKRKYHRMRTDWILELLQEQKISLIFIIGLAKLFQRVV